MGKAAAVTADRQTRNLERLAASKRRVGYEGQNQSRNTEQGDRALAESAKTDHFLSAQALKAQDTVQRARLLPED
ncbi:MAG: hypothetical protein O3A01_02730 [bacterium]|nr:hypothetical protein [bacterium]